MLEPPEWLRRTKRLDSNECWKRVKDMRNWKAGLQQFTNETFRFITSNSSLDCSTRNYHHPQRLLSFPWQLVVIRLLHKVVIIFRDLFSFDAPMVVPGAGRVLMMSCPQVWHRATLRLRPGHTVLYSVQQSLNFWLRHGCRGKRLLRTRSEQEIDGSKYSNS